MTTGLGAFQEAFTKALFVPDEVADPLVRQLVAQPAFAVYRNTVTKGCIDALEANFPAVARLVGRDWFRAAAALHVAAEPPHDGRLLNYGGGFADFLQGFAPASELVYLPDVARLDGLWREAHAAADAAVLDATWLAQRTPQQLAALVLRPHPAARWTWFSDQPVYSIWARNRGPGDDGEDADEIAWHGEGALLTRPADAVVWRAIDKPGAAFLDACAAGLPLAEAAERALTIDPHADLAALLEGLLQAGAFTESTP